MDQTDTIGSWTGVALSLSYDYGCWRVTGEQSTGSSWASMLSHWRRGAELDGPWVCLFHVFAQRLEIWVPVSWALAGWMSSSFFIYFKSRNISSKSGLMNHCKCLMCWQLHATQLHTLFCCHNFKKLLEHCLPPQKRVYPKIWELMYATLPRFICTKMLG